MPDISNSFYGSVSLSDELQLKLRLENLKANFAEYFDEIAAYSDTDIITATHQARKTLKSYRAFVKLLRKCPEVTDWKPTNYLLRDLGKEFSDMRDAHVRKMLLTELNGDLQSSFLQKLLEENHLEIENKEKVLLSPPNHFYVLSTKIKQSHALMDLVDGSEIDRNCIEEGLRSTFYKSSVAFSNSRELKTEEAFHEWRKRLKDLLNQIKLFRDEQDLLDDEQFTRIDSLCEEMGMLNDMSMLKEWIDERESSHQEKAGSTEILTLLKKKISAFHRRLLVDGSSFYDNPDDLLYNLESLIRNE